MILLLATGGSAVGEAKDTVPMTTQKKCIVVYTDKYRVNIGPHVFPTEKYAMIQNRLLEQGLITRHDIIESTSPTQEQLLLVHTPEYLDDLKNLRATARTLRSELPLTKEIIDAYILCAGGTIQAAEFACKNKGCGIHIGGGFHHAFPAHAEGFCYINDIAVAIRVAQRAGWCTRAFVVDCDLHQGNGTARIFQNDPSVFAFSIHQENNYPVKEKGDLDIGLPDGADDQTYLTQMRTVIPSRLDEFKPDLVIYVAGADPYQYDQLGGLRLTKDGLKKRDELVIGYCHEKNIPLVIVLAGGYARDINDTVEIQATTCATGIRFFQNK